MTTKTRPADYDKKQAAIAAAHAALIGAGLPGIYELVGAVGEAADALLAIGTMGGPKYARLHKRMTEHLETR